MSFIDHPVIASLAGAIGLGGLTNQGNPLVASAAPKVAPKASPQNQPEYRQARFFDPRSPQGARGGVPSGMPTEPGAMSPDVQNNPTVMDLLQHFGVHPQQEIDPGLFIHNAHAWAAHPVMSGVLDGLLGGLANTKGSDTVGEGLSNVAQGLAATHDQQVQHVNAQLQMPYQQAMTVASLQDAKQKQELQASTEQYNQSHADMMDGYWQGRENIAQTAAQAQVQKAQLHAKNMVDLANARPQNIDTQTWNGHVSKYLADHVQQGQDPSTDDVAAARQYALEQVGTAKQAPKTAGAIATSHATQKDKQALKGTMSGGSATAGANAPGYIDPTRKAQIAAAEKDLQTFTSKPFAAGDPSQGEKSVLVKGTADYNKALKRRTDARDSLIAGPSKAASGSTPTKYSSNNPFAK